MLFIKRIVSLFMAFCMIVMLFPLGSFATGTASPIFMTASNDYGTVAVGNNVQKVEFTRNNEGRYECRTYIKVNGSWQEFFNSGLPLVQGSEFNDLPSEVNECVNTDSVKSIKLSGSHGSPAYDFDMLVEVKADSELIHFTITNHLAQDINISGYEPVSMFWMDSTPADKVTIFQESPNYQTLGDSTYWNSCFPAAYMWTGGKESAIFFNMQPMDWFSFKNGVTRFKSIQIRSSERQGRTGIGMDLRKSLGAGTRVASGDMVFDFYLYGKESASRPAKIDALNKMVKAFGECFPAEAEWPQNYVDPGKLSYEFYSSKIADQLMLENITYKMTPFNKMRNNVVDSVAGTWTDAPVFPEDTVTEVVRRPDYAVGNLNGHNLRTADNIYGDWNCANNTLIPWVAYERLNPDTEQHEFINKGLDSLKVYYDPDSKLIRSFECSDDYKNSYVEFTFQNFFFGMGTLKASQFRRPSEFDPALGGKYLMGLEGLMELAHNVNYTFPQLFNAKDKTAATSIDEPQLGKPFDVWTGAIYAYDMCMAFDTTGDAKYVTEAENAVDKLFEGMQFTVSNNVFSKQFEDPYDFPVNEESSAPWGVAASQWLYNKTGNTKYLKYSEYFRNIALRLMTWYESSLRDDPVDQSIQSAGLVHDFATADTPSAWENIMTYMPMLMELKNTGTEPSELMLKMYNTFRINNFYMCGPTWDPSVIKTYAANFTSHPAGYLAVEDFYTAETPTAMGLSGPTVYMSSNPFYAYLLFEAFSESSDRDILALNLDINDEPQKMMDSIERNFIYFNPTSGSKSFTIRMKNLEEGSYNVLQTNSSGFAVTEKKTRAELENGFEKTLASGDYLRIKLTLADSAKVADFNRMADAQKKLMLAYQYLQQSGRDFGIDETLISCKESYLKALDFYKKGNYAAATGIVNSFVNRIPAVEQADSVNILASQDVSAWNIKSGSNAALAKYVSSDSGIGGRAVDGKTEADNTWVSGEGNGKHYIVVDLGKSTSIGRYTINHASGVNITSDFEIQSSDDKASWVERDVVKGNTSELTDHSIAPFSARYVRLYITKPMQNDGKIAQVREFELYEADTLPVGDFSTVNDWNIAENAVITTDGSTATIKCAASSWGYTAKTVNYNVDEYPVLQITIPELGAGTQWNVLTNDGSSSDIFLFESSADSGTISVNLKNKTGWSGDKAFSLKLAVIGGEGKYFKVAGIQAIANNANVLQGKTVTATSGDGSKAVDGVVSGQDTWVSDQQGGESLIVDLGSETEINRYVVKHAGLLSNKKDNLTGFTLYSSSDGLEWTQRDKVTGNEEVQSDDQGNVPGTQLQPLVIDMTVSDGLFAEGGATAVASAAGTYISGRNGTNIKKKVSYNVTDYPQLEITFVNMTMPVHMQVWDENGGPIFIIPAAISSEGTYKINLADITGWSGEKSFYIIFYPQAEGSADITGIRALPAGYVENTTKPLVIDMSSSTGLFAEGGATASASTAGTSITGRNGTNVKKKVSYNITDYPQLEVTFANMTMPVHMQVWDESSSPIFIIPAAISSDGTYKINLADITGWSGEKSFYMIFYPQADGSADITSIRALPSVSGNETGAQAGLNENFSDMTAWKYSENASIIQIPSGGAEVACTGGTFGYTARDVTLNLDEYARLQVDIPEVSESTRFHVMVNDGHGDYFLSRTEMIKPGVYNFDLPMITGWSGEKTFTVKLAVIGGAGSFIKVNSLKAFNKPDAFSITDRELAPFSARYLKLTADDLWRNGDGKARICEFEAYSALNAGAPCIIQGMNAATAYTGSFGSACFGRLTSYDIDEFPLLKISVLDMSPGAKWNVSINNNIGGSDIKLMSEDSIQTGTFIFNLRDITGWSGISGYTLKLEVAGGMEKTVEFEEISAIPLDKNQS